MVSNHLLTGMILKKRRMIKYVKAGKYPYLVVEEAKKRLTAISGDFDHIFCTQTYPNKIDEDIFSVKLVSHHASCVLFLFHLSKNQGIFLSTFFGNMRSPLLELG